ncbi:hypothetical protein [Streptomyces sp. NPDC056672]|uniref:hypothetical protein n=1 Tax=Streptomyces sp. NPDC056672 TaxID=3345906 RepID=UPI0036AF7947
MTTTPARVFLPLTDSPLLTRPRPDTEYTSLAVHLAATADPEPATLRALLSITRPDTADRITRALDERTDLPPTALAILIAARPALKNATARLRTHLFPHGNGCHRFTRTMAALAHQPESIDTAFLTTDRFTTAARAADPDALHSLLAPLLTAPHLTGPADAALAALLTARHADGTATPFDLAADAAQQRTRRARVRSALTARREQTITELSRHTGALTLAATLWYDALTAAADTSDQAGEALAVACLAGALVETGQPLDCPWPAVRHRWQQLTQTAHTARTSTPAWEQAWTDAETTAEGSVWDPAQRALVAGYTLLADHVRTTYADPGAPPPTPAHCWATDPAGRILLHTVADHLTGHHGHSPLGHFDDTLLISFIRALAKNRRDKIPGALHIHGLIAAVKAARSKAHLLTRPAAPRLGIVIPTRGEAHRIPAPAPGADRGEDALTAKTAQLAWLLQAHPNARAEILLVDEDPDGASARAAARTQAEHPQIRLTIATRPDDTSAKGGAVLWGLAQLLESGCTTLAYTDLDLTYPLDQLGLLQHALDNHSAGAAIGSRRTASAHGYYPPSGPTPATRLYQQAVQELLQLDVTDPQAGFKAFTAHALRAALPQVTDHGLSFDTELLAVLQHAGHPLAETGIAALHRWTDNHDGTRRDYDTMLTAVHQQAQRHRPLPRTRPTPVWDRIRAAGSLHAASHPHKSDLTLSPAPR